MAKKRESEGAARSPLPSGKDPDKAYVMFAIHPDQLVALKQVAIRLQSSRGGGRADQSEVLRLTLDALAGAGELPAGLKEALAAGIKERKQAARNGGAR